MAAILEEILAHKRMELGALDAAGLQRSAALTPLPRDFLAALTPGNHIGLIAELKRASPSRGILASQLDLLQVARLYAENGACAISVLTDARFFQGRLDTLRRLRFEKQIPLPLLRKDFVIDELQLYETRAAGADAVLLIVAALPDPARLAGLHALALELGLSPLVEVHNEAEIERALRLPGVKLIGINNRDLATFEVSLATTGRLRPLIPAHTPVVSESGIYSAADVGRLARAGVQAVLVGEALVTAPEIAARVRELSGVPLASRAGRRSDGAANP